MTRLDPSFREADKTNRLDVENVFCKKHVSTQFWMAGLRSKDSGSCDDCLSFSRGQSFKRRNNQAAAVNRCSRPGLRKQIVG
jgi:hypothetical protein